MNGSFAGGLRHAIAAAEACARSPEFAQFVETVRKLYPWRFERLPPDVLERDYLRIVDHHLKHLIPRVGPCIERGVRRVIDFGCGSGGSAIALALTYPDIHCCGTDIDEDEIQMARKRAKLYNVSDRCEFHHVSPGEALPFSDGFFDFSLCSSVLEYATEGDSRRFCVREMVRLVAPGRCLFFSVPNRLYPYEVHTGKWGWNYFPRLLGARTVDSSFWEVRRLARPDVLTLERTPIAQLLRPWSSFCVRRNA
jgi:ubiquinone/menaquinone biosynthesis C-methylase UbiE